MSRMSPPPGPRRPPREPRRPGRAARLGLALGLAAPVPAACGPGEPVLEIFAAASLREVTLEVGEAFQRAHPGLELRFDFAGSNLLAEQILSSTRGGVFLSADELQMDRVELTGRVVEGTRTEFLAGELVVVQPPVREGDERIERPEDLARSWVTRLSLAHPEAVPAGRYARRWLMTLGLWDDVEPKVVPAPDVRAAVLAVEAGAAEAGICYATDVAGSGRLEIVLRVTGPAAPPVRYHAAAVQPGKLARVRTDGRVRAGALAFVEFLGSDTARAVFREHGFSLPGAAPRRAFPPRPGGGAAR